MRILLVNPKFARGWRPYTMPPIGLGYLKSSLVKAGYPEVKILDASGLPSQIIRKEIDKYEPDMVGAICFTESRHNSLGVARIAKDISPGIVTVLGGVHPTFMYEQILRNYPFVDVTVRGEGEQAIVNLVKSIENGWDVPPGVAWTLKGKMESWPIGESIKDLDSIPFPDYSDLDISKYKEIAILTSRGCPFQCAFCSAKAMWGNWRYRSVPNIIEELESLIGRYGVKRFTIVDDIFSANPRRTAELCDQILSHNLGIKWKIQTRVDSVNLDLLRFMSEAGCTEIIFGVESGSPEVLRNLNKKEDIEDVVKAFAWTNIAGINSVFNVIMGSPGETRETWEETKDLIRKCRPTRVSTASLRVYPGTPLWTQGGYSEDWFLGKEETLFYTKTMGINEMLRHSREVRTLQAQLKGLKGYFELAKFGVESIRTIPGKVLRSL